jgi:dTDP-4-dehydrorhamnose reductase
MRVLVTGAAGRLGSVISRDFSSAGHQVTALHRSQLDITDGDRVSAAVRVLRPEAIINCVAFNAVDAAETEVATALAVNARGPAILAKAAAAARAVLVHFSTDFVFDGQSREPYTESDSPNPLSVYGASKLAGEEEVRTFDRHYILRIESLFGGRGVKGHRATIDYIIDTLMAGEPVRAFVDRTASPSYVSDVSMATRALLHRAAPYGTYHCVNSGSTTWHDLAVEIAHQLKVPGRITPVTSAEVVTPAKRPQFCALSNDKLSKYGMVMPVWQDALTRHLVARDVRIPQRMAS